MAITNVALASGGAVAAASMYDPSYAPSRAIDANDATQWWSGNADTSTLWISVDLLTAKSIVGFRMLTQGGFRPSIYKIQSSDDNSTWIDRYIRPDQGSTQAEEGFRMLTIPATARYWRALGIPGSSNPTGGWSVYSLELFAADNAAVDNANPIRGLSLAVTGLSTGVGTSMAIIDGDDSTYTLCNGYGDITKEWMILDFGTPVHIGSYRTVAVNASWYASAFIIESSDDQVTWTERHHATGAGSTDSGVIALTTHGTARYWRFRPLTAGGSQGMGYTTWELHDYGTSTNRATPARGCLCVTSPDAGGSVCRYACIDQNQSTYVLFGGTDLSGASLTFDFQSPKAVDTFRIFWVNTSWIPNDYHIESSTDNSTWTSRHHVTSASGVDTGWITLTTPATAQYWRLRGVSSLVSGMGPTEIELLGLATTNQTLTAPLVTNTSVLRAPSLIPPSYLTAPTLTGSAPVFFAPVVEPVPTLSNQALVAAGASVTVSGNRDGVPTSYVIDENDNTYVLVPATAGTIAAQWVRVDLGATKTIYKFRLGWINETWAPTEWYIEYSADGSTGWTSVYHTTSGAALDSGLITLSSPSSARYWQIRPVAMVGFGTGMGPTKLELWGAAPAQSLTAPHLTGATPTFYAAVVAHSTTLTAPKISNASSVYPALLEQTGPPSNYALASLGASVTTNRYPTAIANVIDGNDGTYWEDDSPSTQAGDVIRIDMGTPRSISSVTLIQSTDPGYAFDSFLIESSTDDATWTTRYTSGSGSSTSTFTHALDQTATARYWRLVCVAQGASHVHGVVLYSVKLFGPSSLPAHTLLPSLLTNVSVAQVPVVALWHAFLVPPTMTNVSVLRAPVVMFSLQALAAPRVVGSATLRVPSVFAANTMQGLVVVRLINVATLRPPAIDFVSLDGLRVPLWGSTVPFWLEEVAADGSVDRATYRLPFRIARGGPGRRISLPGLGTRVPFWIEEHPNHPGSYYFPVMDGVNPRRVMIPGFGRAFTTWLDEHPDHPGVFVFPATPAVAPASDHADGLRVSLFGANVRFLLLDEAPISTPPRGTKVYAMALRLAGGGGGHRIDLPLLGAHVPFWIEEDDDVPDVFVIPVQG
jgi:hypothetical protein